MATAPDPALVRVFEDLLLAERRRVLRTVATTEAELAALEPHQAGSFVQETAREEAAAILGRLAAHERQALEEIELALERLRQGRYGTCEGCGEAIPFARLRARPATRYCVACQAAREAAGPT